MPETLSPSVGWGVVHLFCKLTGDVDPDAIETAVKEGTDDDQQVVSFSVLGHKADLGFMALGPDWVRLRRLQAALDDAGLEIVDSYVSLTEISEYAQDMPEEQRDIRLHPRLPPVGKPAFCFYPMSKRRGQSDNWYALDHDARKALMMDHGKSGRRFAGRILQVITGSTGLDDYEWGVTLFGEHPDDLKDTVYTMRFDEASAKFAEFGPFYAGIVDDINKVLSLVGARQPGS
ncbi:MAG: chlorite dismutase family protein [Actinomycetota bacterium]|nr:chlorite dismutase family protein [Actinomycetota bacterium]